MKPNGTWSRYSLLAVFAHPDDESIACGGLLARCAELGVRVSLVCVTHGESQAGEPDEDLSRVRAAELAEAARVLGIGEVVLLDYPDGYLPWVDAQDLEGRLALEIRRLEPDVVVTFGHDGLYWHPDHIAVCERTTAAIASLGHDAPALYYVTMPPGAVRTMVDEYVKGVKGDAKTSTAVLGITNPDAFGAAAAPPTLVIDTGAAAVRKLAALKCHRTQIDGVIAHLSDRDAPRLLGIEHFHRAPVGSAGDAFIERLAR